MSESVVATIEKVIPKSGTGKNGKPYTLYKIVAGGQEYTSFDAEWLKAVGQEHTLTYEKSQNGQYINRRIVDPKPQGRGNPKIDEIAQQVSEIHKQVGEIFALLKSRYPE